MMVAPREFVHASCRNRHAEDAATIRRLRTSLERAVRMRDRLNDEVLELREIATHWFVADDAGYCQACGLPEGNRRHVERRVSGDAA